MRDSWWSVPQWLICQASFVTRGKLLALNPHYQCVLSSSLSITWFLSLHEEVIHPSTQSVSHSTNTNNCLLFARTDDYETHVFIPKSSLNTYYIIGIIFCAVDDTGNKLTKFFFSCNLWEIGTLIYGSNEYFPEYAKCMKTVKQATHQRVEECYFQSDSQGKGIPEEVLLDLNDEKKLHLKRFWEQCLQQRYSFSKSTMQTEKSTIR